MKNRSFHLWLIRLIGVIVPQRLRADWRQEWEAELRHREALLAQWDKLNWQTKLDLWRRSIGALADALLLQPQRWEDEMFQDFRFGARMLLKHKGFTLVAVLTLALGIGATTALFSIVKAVVIHPLPFAQPERLLQARYVTRPGIPPGDHLAWINRSEQSYWRTQSRSFARIGGYWYDTLTLRGEGMPELIRGFSVTPELLPALGIAPALGRYFLPEESRTNSERLIILSHELWRLRFGADPGIVGKTIRVVGGVYVVVGVMPVGFNFPLRQRADIVRLPSEQMRFWTLLSDDRIKSHIESYHAILQLKPGVSVQQAQAEVDTLFAQSVRENVQANTNLMGIKLVPLKEEIIGNAGTPLLFLLGATGLVVLIVCANLASLLLARADKRRKEMAIRQSLGASGARLVRQALTESLLLALLGGGAGALLASWSLKLLLQLSPHNIPRLAEARIDAGTLGLTLAVTILAGLLFGAFPAWRSVRVDLNETLKQTAGRRGARMKSLLAPSHLLVAVEIALALVLTLGGGLLLNSFARLMQVDPGLRVDGLTAAIIPANAAFLRQVIERLKVTPGVEAAASGNGLPLTEVGNAAYLSVEGRSPSAPDDPATLTRTHIVSADYLRVLSVPLLRGRLLTAEDTSTSLRVAVISETTAQRFWPGADPIGSHISLGDGRGEGQKQWLQVVGIVKSTHYGGLDRELMPEVYAPVEQRPFQQGLLFVRSSLPRADITNAIRQAVAAVDKYTPVYHIIPMADLLADSVSARRFTLLLLGSFSLLALLLAMMGVYGVVAYTVAERTSEIGLRMALGAQGRDVLGLIFAQGVKPVLMGSVAGIIVALALRRVLASMLYGVTVTDPLTYCLVIFLLWLVAFLACWLPARRATKVDPLIALRHE